jgi:hypothetical protein
MTSFALKTQAISVVPNSLFSKTNPEGNWNHCSLIFSNAVSKKNAYL